MERLNIEHFDLTSLRIEHYQRYAITSLAARGFVVDCACGIGYGSTFFNGDHISSYHGFDPDQASITTAVSKYAGGGKSFEVASLEKLPLEDGIVDTFVSLETLEHLVRPKEGVREIKRVLSNDGIFIGSVPTSTFDRLAEEVYGKNPFHLQRFNFEDLTRLLTNHFETTNIFSLELKLGTVFRTIDIHSPPSLPVQMCPTISYTENSYDEPLGSYFFICGSERAVQSATNKFPPTSCYMDGVSKILIDNEERMPLLKLAEKRWSIMQDMETMIRARDEAIAAQAKMLEERWAIMESMEAMIKARDKEIRAYKTTLNHHFEKD